MPGNMKISFFPAAGVLSLAFAAVCSASPVWETDWNKALEKAGRSGQPVLVDFTGPGWCPECIYLRHNILNTDAFAKYAEDNSFMLVKLDFPRTAGKLPPEQLKLHEELMHRYGISVFTSVLLMEGNGVPYARIVEAAGKTRLKLKEAVAAARALKGKDKMREDINEDA